MRKQELVTPCYVLDEQDFLHNLKCLKKELSARFEKYIVGYSFKTNSLPRVLNIVKENGCMAEVVSEEEFILAKEIGFENSNIIYNGPIKTKESFIESVTKGCIVNIDSHRELEWIGEITKSNCRLGVRVNFDLEKKLPGQTSTRECGGRFGFCYENGELKRAIEIIRGKGKKVSGLHMHVSNASKSPEVYLELARMACKIVKEEGLDIEYIDFGGGYFGGGDNGEQYRKYLDAIYAELLENSLDGVCVIVEPGASVVATSMSYFTKVVDVKDTTYGRFVFTDGTRLDIDPFMVKEKYAYNISGKGNTYPGKQVVCGYTCMEKDRIMTLDNSKELRFGDMIEYRIVGSYTIGFNNMFISLPPNVYSKSNEDAYTLIREKWSVSEYLIKNRW